MLWICSKDKKLLKSMKFPKEYEEKIDLKPVNWEAIKGWVAKRATELLGIEDEVLIAYIFEQIDGMTVRVSKLTFQAGACDTPQTERLTPRLGLCSNSTLACFRSVSQASWRRMQASLSRQARRASWTSDQHLPSPCPYLQRLQNLSMICAGVMGPPGKCIQEPQRSASAPPGREGRGAAQEEGDPGPHQCASCACAELQSSCQSAGVRMAVQAAGDLQLDRGCDIPR